MKAGDLIKMNGYAWDNIAGKIGLILKEPETKRGLWTILINDVKYELYESEFNKL